MSRRGQSTVELALAALVFVTVLLGGIWFAEVGHLTLEVTQSANTAVFDTTAAKLHRVWDPGLARADWSLWRDAVQQAGPAATARHASFDARARQVLTRAGALAVTCEESQQVPWLMPRAQGYPNGSSGMACEARATITSVRVPQKFANDPSGFFQARHWTRRELDVQTARFTVLLDDWGLAGPDEREECRLTEPCQNPGFHDLARLTYLSGVNLYAGRAQALLDHVTKSFRPLPMQEGKFRMSFRGSESNYLERLPGSHGDTVFETTAYEWPVQYSTPRSRCWLGDPC